MKTLLGPVVVLLVIAACVGLFRGRGRRSRGETLGSAHGAIEVVRTGATMDMVTVSWPLMKLEITPDQIRVAGFFYNDLRVNRSEVDHLDLVKGWTAWGYKFPALAGRPSRLILWRSGSLTEALERTGWLAP